VTYIKTEIDCGLDFTLGEFPDGFRARDLGNKIKTQVDDLRMVRIYTPRMWGNRKPRPGVYNFEFLGETGSKRWGYIHEVSEYVISDRNVSLDIAAAEIARPVNGEVRKFLEQP
jgi:hypothetical protein